MTAVIARGAPRPHRPCAGARRRIAFSGKAIIVKLAYRYGVDAVTLIMLRMLFALPMFLAHGMVGRAAASRRCAPRDWLGVLGLGISGYYLASFLDFLGLQYVTASLERLILYLNPTLVLLLGWVLYRRAWSRRQLLGMAISYAGVLLVFGHEVSVEGRNVALGALLVFASAVSYAVYLVYSGEFVKRLGSLRLVGLATSVACVCCIAQFPLLRPVASALRGRAAGDLAVGAERHAVHGRAGAAGDDGHRAGRRRRWPRRPAWSARCRPSCWACGCWASRSRPGSQSARCW